MSRALRARPIGLTNQLSQRGRALIIYYSRPLRIAGYVLRNAGYVLRDAGCVLLEPGYTCDVLLLGRVSESVIGVRPAGFCTTAGVITRPSTCLDVWGGVLVVV